MLEHPLTLPFVDTLVRSLSLSLFAAWNCLITDLLFILFLPNTLQIGTADSVMGLPRSLTEKLIEEAL